MKAAVAALLLALAFGVAQAHLPDTFTPQGIRVTSGLCGPIIFEQPMELNSETVVYSVTIEDVTKPNPDWLWPCGDDPTHKHQLLATCSRQTPDGPANRIRLTFNEHFNSSKCTAFSPTTNKVYESEPVIDLSAVYEDSGPISIPVWRTCVVQSPMVNSLGGFRARLDCPVDNRVLWVDGRCRSDVRSLWTSTIDYYYGSDSTITRRKTLVCNLIDMTTETIIPDSIADFSGICDDWFFPLRKWLGTVFEPWRCD